MLVLSHSDTRTTSHGVYGMVRVPRNLDSCLLSTVHVLVELLSVFDPTLIRVVEPLESFISAYQYSVQCPSL